MGAPADFAEANARLVAPPGQEDRIIPLPVARGNGSIVSCWSLSPDEIAEIQETGCIWLSVMSAVTQPPVFVTGHKHEVFDDAERAGEGPLPAEAG